MIKNKIRNPYIFATICWFFVRLFLTIIYIIIYNDFTCSHFIENISVIYDNEHYINIANNGYTKTLEYAFFPLMPIIIRIIGIQGAIWFNTILSYLSCIMFTYLVTSIYKIKNNLFAIALFIFSPIQIMSFFTYTEYLLVFSSLLAIILYKKNCNKLLVGIALGFSINSRALGCALFFAILLDLIYKAFLKYRETKKIIIKDVILLSFSSCMLGCIYPLYLYFQTGSLFTFMNVQYTEWNREKTNILNIWVKAGNYTLKAINHYKDLPIYQILTIFEYVLILFLFVFCIYGIMKINKRKYRIEIIYLIIYLILIFGSIRTSYFPLCSMYRYIFACYPFYILFENKNEQKLIGKFDNVSFIVLVTMFGLTSIIAAFLFSHTYFY